MCVLLIARLDQTICIQKHIGFLMQDDRSLIDHVYIIAQRLQIGRDV